MSTPLAQRVRERLARGASGDGGFSLVELIVAMSIFTIFITLVLSAIIGLSRGAVKAQLATESASSILVVFQNMDRQVRYADSINFPGKGASGATYIEFRTPAASTIDNITRCTQWRYTPSLNRLETRQWNDVVGAVRPAWSTKLSNVIPSVDADYPFEMVPASQSGTARQQLVLTVQAGNGAGTDASGAEVATTFVARNSSIESLSNSDSVLAGTSNFPVCIKAGDRP